MVCGGEEEVTKTVVCGSPVLKIMERIRRPVVDPCYLGENFNVELLEQTGGGGGGGGGGALGFTHEPLMNPEKLRFEEEGRQPILTSTQNLGGKMSFVEMLRGVESSPSFIGHNFEFLLSMHHRQNQKKAEMDSGIQAPEPESCITNDVSEAHSPTKFQCKDPQSSSCRELEIVSSACNEEAKSPENREPHESNKAGPVGSSREKTKRKRTRPKKEEVESQRMTHIAVERNRRRKMNDHLNALRSLMPTSYIGRGDQASIIGGAIDFVKELEQLLQSLEARKRMRKSRGDGYHSEESVIVPFNGLFTSLQYTTYSSLSSSATAHSSGVGGYNVDDDAKLQVYEYMKEGEGREGNDIEGEAEGNLKTENKSAAAADIEVLLIEKRHVNLKVLSPRRPGQLVRAIAALEDLRLTILHLNVKSFQCSVLYSFNLKMEDDCQLGSADEIATAVHETFRHINSL